MWRGSHLHGMAPKVFDSLCIHAWHHIVFNLLLYYTAELPLFAARPKLFGCSSKLWLPLFVGCCRLLGFKLGHGMVGTISLASHAQQLCASDWWPKRWKITDLTIFIIRVQKLGRLFDDLRRRGMTLFYSSINSISSRGVKLGIPTWASSLWMSPSSPVQRW